MDFFNDLINKFDSTKEYLVNKFSNDSNNPIEQYQTNKKEINFNQYETKKVKYLQKAKNYELNVQISGKSIFQNLIITVSAIQNNEPLPIKCHWKRIYDETIITIKDINSFSYMPNAEDIGYIIEVEVFSLDDPSDISIAQYGPIIIDKDMESAVELLLTSEKTHFNLYLFDKNTQEKIKDKEYMLYLKNDEMILVNIEIGGKENILERCIYSQLNPIIKLSPTNVTQFNFIFVNYDTNNKKGYENNFNNNNEEITYSKKNEYEFLAMSKQCRELIYLLIQFFIIDEKIKNNKLYSLLNYDTLPLDNKLGITDLLGELNSLKIENKHTMQNMNLLNYINKQLNNDYKDLEEDFKITLDQINQNISLIQEDINKSKNFISEKNKKNILMEEKNAKIEEEWMKKYEKLNTLYTSLKMKETKLKEEQKHLLKNEKKTKTVLDTSNNQLKGLQDKNSFLKNECTATNKKLDQAKKEYNNIKNKLQDYQNQLKNLKEQNEILQKNQQDKKNITKEKSEISKIKKSNEKFIEENKTLLTQRDLLNKEKAELGKQLEKSKQEKDLLIKELSLIEERFNSNNNNKDFINNLKQKNNNIKNEYQKLKNDFDLLKNQHQNLKDLYEKNLNSQNSLNNSIMSMSVMSSAGYALSPEEYEEYENLKKNKDENEALIMQLKSNNDAKQLEINELKDMLVKLKKNFHS